MWLINLIKNVNIRMSAEKLKILLLILVSCNTCISFVFQNNPRVHDWYILRHTVTVWLGYTEWRHSWAEVFPVNWRGFCCCRKKLLDGPMCPDLRYLISVVDLLATCAEVSNSSKGWLLVQIRKKLMRNCAEKTSSGWCLNISVHSRESKTRAADVYRYFVSKIFINY